MPEESAMKHDARPTSGVGSVLLHFISRHGAPLVFAGLLWWILWWGHAPELSTPDEAMWHGSWIGLGALVYLALQIRSVLLLPRKGVLHPVIAVIVSLLPLLVVLYAGLDWIRGAKSLSVFQVITMQQATMAVLIDVVFLNYVSMRLSQHSLPVAIER